MAGREAPEAAARGGKTPSPEAQAAGRRRPKHADLLEVLRVVREEAKSVREACRVLGLNHSHTLTLLNRDRYRDQYTRAREARGEQFGEMVVAIGLGVLKGQMKVGDEFVAVDPKAARVAVESFKWAAARMAPKLLGDRPVPVEPAAGSAWRVVIED